MKKALLIIDFQNSLVEEKPFRIETITKNIKTLLEACREKNIEVIYVQHEEDDGEFKRGSEGWKIFNEIAPIDGEKIISKRYNSAFKETELKDYLQSKDIDELIMVGMQTEYCFDTSCKVAFEYGYKVIIPEMTNTTFDNEFMTGEKIYNYYNFKIFKDRFAKIDTVDNIIANL